MQVFAAIQTFHLHFVRFIRKLGFLIIFLFSTRVALGRVPWDPVSPWIFQTYAMEPLKLEIKPKSRKGVNPWIEIPNITPAVWSSRSHQGVFRKSSRGPLDATAL